MNVLILCEGNICRSPMAEALLQEACQTITVLSAGVGALVGHPADATAIDLMRERGLDISTHRAVQVSRSMCSNADLILVMEADQKRRLARQYPFILGKIFMLTGDPAVDVPDPFRRGEPEFRRALSLIDSSIVRWKQKLVLIGMNSK